MAGLIQDGDWVVVVFKGNKMRLCQVGDNQEVKVNNARCGTACLVGLPYGVELDASPCEVADEVGRKRNAKLHKSMEDAVAVAIKKGKKVPDGQSKVNYAKLTVVDTRAEQAEEDMRLFEQHRLELETELNGMTNLLNSRMANESELEIDAAVNIQNTETEYDVGDSTMTITVDNRNLTDKGGSTAGNQSLTDDQIIELRKGGHSAIVKALVENSSTFKDKTEYSKDKYVAKKKKKYSARIRIMQATAASIANVTYEKTIPVGNKMLGLRAVDSFGHILSYAHVFAGAKVMVVETLSGLMVGAVAERLAGHGSLIAPYFGKQCHKIVTEYFNLKQHETDIIKDMSIIPLLQEQTQQQDEENSTSAEIVGVSMTSSDDVASNAGISRVNTSTSLTSTTDVTMTSSVSTADVSLNAETGDTTNTSTEASDIPVSLSAVADDVALDADKTSASTSHTSTETVDVTMTPSVPVADVSLSTANGDTNAVSASFVADGVALNADKTSASTSQTSTSSVPIADMALYSMDSLIIVTKYDPASTLMPLLKYLAPSRPFVVFSEYLEPLAHCYNMVRDANVACDVRIHETLTREYQVLPYRTHPVMRGSASSGYMLYGYKIMDGKVPDDFVERRSNKRARE